jgi:hypothetical protein
MRVHSPLLLSLLILAVGCAAEAGTKFVRGAPSSGVSAELSLQPPERGFQLESLGTMIEPGDDIRWCEALQLPGSSLDTYAIDRIESALSPHAQDLIVSAVAPGSDTELAMDVGSRVPCTRAGEAFGEDLGQLLATQKAYHDQRFPDGVGRVLHGAQKIAVDYHYVNDGDQPLPAKLKLNFHVVDANAVQHVARIAGFNNTTIYTPPGGRSSHLAECSVTQPLLLSELVRRTHRHGTSFGVWMAGGARDGELLWYSASPDDAQHTLASPLRLEQGQGLRFQCDYQNGSNLELRYGVNASDETCGLDATYWLPDEQQPPEPQGCLLLEVDPDGVARK